MGLVATTPTNIAAGRVSGDRVERGPGHWRRYRADAALARRRLGANAFRLSIEWSRVFPRSTAGGAHARASSTGSPTAPPCATTPPSCARSAAAA